MRSRTYQIWTILTILTVLTLNSCCKLTSDSAFLTIGLEGFSQNELNNLTIIGLPPQSQEREINFERPNSNNEIEIEFRDELIEYSQLRILVNDTTSIDTLFFVNSRRANERQRCPGHYDVEISFTYNSQTFDFSTRHVLMIVR